MQNCKVLYNISKILGRAWQKRHLTVETPCPSLSAGSSLPAWRIRYRPGEPKAADLGKGGSFWQVGNPWSWSGFGRTAANNISCLSWASKLLAPDPTQRISSSLGSKAKAFPNIFHLTFFKYKCQRPSLGSFACNTTALPRMIIRTVQVFIVVPKCAECHF